MTVDPQSPGAPPGGPASPADILPPIEPPSAGFIVQLFLVPAVIVCIIVAIYLAFNWLVDRGNDVGQGVKNLEEGRGVPWQQALAIAQELNRKPELRADSDPCRRLGKLLADQVAAGKTDLDAINFRRFLCTAVGGFQVADGLPAILTAAKTQRDPKEWIVRRAALEAIAVLADRVRGAGNGELRHADLLPVLVAAAEDNQNPPVVEQASAGPDADTALTEPLRSPAAFALGVVGGTEAIAKLRTLLGDPYPDVRYNAATGLARHGDPACIPVILEMLDPTAAASVDLDRGASAKRFKRSSIIRSGLEATKELARRGTVDVGPLTKAAEALTTADLDEEIRLLVQTKAQETLNEIRATNGE